MIVVAIIGIIAAIAIPNYTDYVRRSKISEAVSGLSQMATKLEQYFQDRRTYACDAGTVAELIPATNNFQFTCPILSDTTYTVRATGTGQMAGFTYEITPTGKNTVAVPTGWTGAPKTCWIVNKGGGC